MIKRYLLVILSISLFLSSCVQSPDDMLKQFNDNLLEDIGGGLYQKGDVIINPELIPTPPNNIYHVMEGDTLRIRISQAYYDYSWLLKDNQTEEEVSIPGYYIVYVGPQEYKLMPNRSYTLTVNCKNRNGVSFMDTTTIRVVKR